MEETETSGTYESKKLLYKYQFAFLLMQRSFTSLAKIISTREAQLKYRFLSRWQSKMPQKVFKIQETFSFLEERLNDLSRLHRAKWKGVTRRFFMKLKYSSLQFRIIKAEEAKNKAKEKKYKKKINEMLLECSALTSKNIELEEALAQAQQKEQIYSQQTASLDKAPAEERNEYNRLKKENEMIRSQEVDMEVKVSSFLRQMTEFLKQADASRQSETGSKVRHSKKKH